MMPNATQAPIISEGDRLSFTFFIAIAAHAIIILGVGFSSLSHRS